jgi:quercetin dioxygenase-like cupin family protein
MLEPAGPRLGKFEDERGLIEDLLTGGFDSVTRIFTRKGHVRGNHVHKHTTQWTYVVSGVLLAISAPDVPHETICEAGSLIEEPMGIPHAWQALSDCTVLVFTRGPRSGEDYETDTVRLAPEDRLL